MRIHRLAPLAVLLVAPAATAAPRPEATLAIRVYDMTGDRMERGPALAAAAAVLAPAGVHVEWLSGPDVPTPQALVLRLVRQNAVAARPGTLALGYAVVDTAGRRGTVATIFLERIEWLASAAGTPVDELLGLAIAHEVGHLLMGTNQHSRAGLMRAQWTAAELRGRHPGDWRFASRDGDRLREGLAGRLGTGPAPAPPLAALDAADRIRGYRDGSS